MIASDLHFSKFECVSMVLVELFMFRQKHLEEINFVYDDHLVQSLVNFFLVRYLECVL